MDIVLFNELIEHYGIPNGRRNANALRLQILPRKSYIRCFRDVQSSPEQLEQDFRSESKAYQG